MMRARLNAAIGFASALVISCGGEGISGGPMPLGADAAAEATSDAGPDVSSDSQDAAVDQDTGLTDVVVVPRRTVVTRDPFGNYQRTGNLLHDGDFEWMGGGMTTQYPWLKMPDITGFVAPTAVIGARCRSGLKCASLDVGEGISGFGVRTQDAYLQVSAWAKPPTADCSLASVALGGCFHAVFLEPVPAVSPTPGADGWCHYQGTAEAPDDSPCVFVSSDVVDQGVVLIDDVVLEASATLGSRSRSLAPMSEHALQLVAELRAAASEFAKPKPPMLPRSAPMRPTHRIR